MKSLFEKNGSTYKKAGDYYLPNLGALTSIIKSADMAGQGGSILRNIRRRIYGFND